MRSIPLFNLYLGAKHPGEQFGTATIGPFVVTVVDDYEERIERMPRNAHRTDAVDSETGTRTTSFTESSDPPIS
jgi:hypothetical protein